ncbi:putative reverse transcriptase domain, reverse transcriptase zinc-binding domain protein [Tanacetum coccineum]
MSRSRIDFVMDHDNVLHEGTEVPIIFVDHYMQFLGVESHVAPFNHEGLFVKKLCQITDAIMIRDVNDDEIRTAMFSIGNDKAPGPDGRMIRNSFFININGGLHGYFKGKRSLRQGDPMSPYLFTLVMEILTLIFKHKIREDDDFVCHNKCSKQKIINICFADDFIMFARGDVQSAKTLIEALNELKDVLGLVPSISKSTIFFCNVSDHVKGAILHLMPFEKGTLSIKYLGVPFISSRLLYKDYNILVERVRKRIGD